MRFRLFLALASASFLMAGVAIQACGGDSEVTSPTVDASPDTATPNPPKDAATDTADAAPPCDKTKDYLGDIPDASIADGASTTGECVACVKAKCNSQVAACGADCSCQGIATVALACFLNTQSPLSCASGFGGVPAATQTLGLNLLTCVTGGCKTECATAAFLDAGADADAGM